MCKRRSPKFIFGDTTWQDRKIIANLKMILMNSSVFYVEIYSKKKINYFITINTNVMVDFNSHWSVTSSISDRTEMYYAHHTRTTYLLKSCRPNFKQWISSRRTVCQICHEEGYIHSYDCKVGKDNMMLCNCHIKYLR